MKKYFLVIDTSSEKGLCAITDQQKTVVFKKYINAKSSHSEHLFVSIQKALSDMKIDFSEITKIIYTAGPGSFTGLRIVYSAVKGFVMATGVESHGVSTLKALIYNIKDEPGYKGVLIKGSANDVYSLIIDHRGKEILPENCYDITQILDISKKICDAGNEITFIGSGALYYRDLLFGQQETSKKVHIPTGIVPEGKDEHTVTAEGMLSLLEQKSIDDINYLKASYAEIKAMQK